MKIEARSSKPLADGRLTVRSTRIYGKQLPSAAPRHCDGAEVTALAESGLYEGVIVATLAHFERAVERLENGQWPADALNQDSATNTLIDRLCMAPWSSCERDRAQVLVARLCRILRRL
jgi:hypothetical protein